MDKKKIAQELGRSGGNATLRKHGTEHYRKIIQKRWEKYREEKEKKQNENTT